MMNLRILAGRAKKKITRGEGNNIGEGAIERRLADMLGEHNKPECLDVGSGVDKSDGLMTLDIREEFDPYFCGDLRCLFAPGYTERDEETPPGRLVLEDYPSLMDFPENEFMVLKLQHIIEHIEWIYQEFLFWWIEKTLAPGGMVYIATPNFAYSVGVYMENRKKQLAGKAMSYPISEHTYLKPGVQHDLQRWVNFKIMSGCSPGDTHNSAFDRLWLYEALKICGLERISIHDGATLKAIAFKPGMQQYSVDEAVRRVVSP